MKSIKAMLALSQCLAHSRCSKGICWNQSMNETGDLDCCNLLPNLWDLCKVTCPLLDSVFLSIKWRFRWDAVFGPSSTTDPIERVKTTVILMILFLISTNFTQHLLDARQVCVNSRAHRDEIHSLPSIILYSIYLYFTLSQEGLTMGLILSNKMSQSEFCRMPVLWGPQKQASVVK